MNKKQHIKSGFEAAAARLTERSGSKVSREEKEIARQYKQAQAFEKDGLIGHAMKITCSLPNRAMRWPSGAWARC